MLSTPGYFAIDCGTRSGIVYAHSGTRTSLRRRAAPKQNRTFRQQICRSDFASLAAEWSLGLTTAQQNSWSTYATAIGELTAGCTPVTKNGYQWFQALNLARTNAQFRSGVTYARFLTAPTTADRGSAPPTLTFVGVSGGVFLVGLSFTGVPTVVPRAFGYVGPGLSDAVTSVGNPWHFFGAGAGSAGGSGITIASTPATPDNWYAAWPPQIGSRVRLKARVQFDDGRMTRATRAIVTVAAL